MSIGLYAYWYLCIIHKLVYMCSICFFTFVQFKFKIFAWCNGANPCFPFTYHLRGSIKSYLLLNSLQTRRQRCVQFAAMSFDWAIEVAKKKTDWNAVNICKNIIIMANRCRSFVKCLHLKVPTLKPRYEWIYEIGDETTTTATTAVYWNSGRLYIVFVILVTLFFCIKTLHDWENLARI